MDDAMTEKEAMAILLAAVTYNSPPPYEAIQVALDKIDALTARVAAQQPVIDAAREVVTMWRSMTLAWGPPVSTLREVYPGFARGLDALSGSVEADTPAEVCRKCGTAECLDDARSGWYDDDPEEAGAPAAEPAPDRSALTEFADDIERRYPLLREPDPLSDWSKGVAWAVDRARALAGAGAPTESADALLAAADRLVDMWQSSPKTRSAIRGRYGPLAWALDAISAAFTDPGIATRRAALAGPADDTTREAPDA